MHDWSIGLRGGYFLEMGFEFVGEDELEHHS